MTKHRPTAPQGRTDDSTNAASAALAALVIPCLANDLHRTHAIEPRLASFIELCDLAFSAFGSEPDMCDERLLANPAAAPLLRYTLASLARFRRDHETYVSGDSAPRNPTHDRRKLLAGAFGFDGDARRSPIADELELVAVFDAAYRSATLGRFTEGSAFEQAVMKGLKAAFKAKHGRHLMPGDGDKNQLAALRLHIAKHNPWIDDGMTS